jgi:16S rRNA (cytidine1402-2'-O)-methyltransferase
VLTALLVAGLPSDRFYFAGFLPPRQAARRTALAAIAGVPGTLLFFEGPSRLAASLADMAEVLGDRPAAVARELTKLFEETVRGGLVELSRRYATSAPPRGEIVVIVGPPQAETVEAPTLDATLSDALERSSMRDAVAEVALQLGLPRKTVYARALALSEPRE